MRGDGELGIMVIRVNHLLLRGNADRLRDNTVGMGTKLTVIPWKWAIGTLGVAAVPRFGYIFYSFQVIQQRTGL